MGDAGGIAERITFDSLVYYIENESELNERYLVRIETARNILQGIVNGLESILSPKEEYVSAEDLRDLLIKSTGHDIRHMSELEVRKITENYKEVMQTLEMLKENPEIIYRDRTANGRLLFVLQKMGDFYAWKEQLSRPPVSGETNLPELLD